MAAVGILLDETVDQYYQLADSVETGIELEEHKKAINDRIQLVNAILTKVDTDLAENEKLWYKELSGSETETQQFVWETFKEFEGQNN